MNYLKLTVIVLIFVAASAVESHAGGFKPDHFGPGVGMDAFGNAVKHEPFMKLRGGGTVRRDQFGNTVRTDIFGKPVKKNNKRVK